MTDKKNIIIFSASGEVLDSITVTAGEFGFDEISVSDGSGARELLDRKFFDIAFINTPLESEFGLDLAAYASKRGCGAIASAASKHCDEIAKKMGDADVFILPRPLSKQLVLQAFRYVMISNRKNKDLNIKNTELEKKLHDVKLIDRAKCVLVEYLRISEADAHRQIQKRAMDMRMPQAVIAQDILKTYEM